ncbi:hypothetical protein ES705_47092 [subsurface metagenome]
MSITPIIAILAIAALEIVAMTQGINGVLLAGSVAVIAGLGGWTAKKVKDTKSEKRKPPSA